MPSPYFDFRYGSLLTYTPKGMAEGADGARRAVRQIKSDQMLQMQGGGQQSTAQNYAGGLAAECKRNAELADLLRGPCALVPVPASTLPVEGGLWVPNRIALAMVEQGLGSEVLPCLQRSRPIRKSATSSIRPSFREHYDSMTANPSLHWPSRLVLVDDVVTWGNTLVGAAARLREVAPNAEIVAFGMMRVVSNSKFVNWVQPTVGMIRVNGEACVRDP